MTVLLRLVRVELRRLFARRLARVAVVAGLVISGIALYAVYDTSRPPTAQEQQQAQQEFERAQREFAENSDQMVADCERHPLGSWGTTPCRWRRSRSWVSTASLRAIGRPERCLLAW